MSPAKEADRRTLIRRLYFDLLGLPPSPEEIEAFVSDGDPQAYEKLIDRLLCSPQYGERWARHWLDVVHYGDTHGYDKDKPRPHAWPYRDYVIRAFNSDKPYARFIREQIAGDVLWPHTRDGIVATGMIAAGPWDFISHVEVPESKIDGQVARNLDRDDMVRTVIETFNSMTVGCARCHHHKFDPISQQDYYGLQAVFAAVDRANRPFDVDPAVALRRQELQARHDALSAEKESLQAEANRLAGDRLKAVNAQIEKLQRDSQSKPKPEFGYHSQISPRQDVVKWVQVDLGKPTSVEKIIVVGCHDNFNDIGAGFGFPVRFKIEISDDPKFNNSTLIVDRTDEDVPNPGVQPQSFDAGGRRGRYVRVTATKLAPRKNDYIFALAELMAIAPRGENVAAGAEVTALDSIEAPVRWAKRNLTDGYYFGVTLEQIAQKQLAKLHKRREEILSQVLTPKRRERMADVQRQLQAISQELAKLPEPQWVYAAATNFEAQGNFKPTQGQPRDIRVLQRGSVVNPAEPALPGGLSAVKLLPADFELADENDEGARRAALADWLADERNPLTWRSLANRVWLYHFGRGLVDTPNDFGRMGEAPSHPQLLDWLAVELRDSGGSLKRLHRLICTSAVYRQSSVYRADCFARDPDNRFLWRVERRRLEAEAIRDAALAVGGALDTRMYGPGFQDFVIEKPEHSPHYQYHLYRPGKQPAHRRSIYRFLVRSQQQPWMTSLDCADPSMRVPKRNETVTVNQALAMLNNKFMLDVSQRFARRLQAEERDLSGQITLAGRLALGRDFQEAEVQALADYARHHGLINTCRLIFNLNEFCYVD